MTASRRPQVGLLGGTFDPVHQGHLGLAEEVHEKFGLDRILFIPAYRSPHKKGLEPAPPEHRMEMLRRALGHDPRFALSDLEFRRKGLSYTVDTLRALREENPDTEFHLIMGMDTFEEFGSWKEAGRILEACHLIVGTRPGHPLNSAASRLSALPESGPGTYTRVRREPGREEWRHTRSGSRIVFFELTPRNVASTDVREKIARGENVENLLPPEVESYIMNHRLYNARSNPDPG